MTNSFAQIILQDAKKAIQKIDFSALENKTILITGASGLIGTHLLACLKFLNNISPGFVKGVMAVMHSEPPDYLKSFLDYDQTKIYKGDLTDYNFCRQLPNTDLIIHAAGYGQPKRFLEDQVKTIHLNTATTLNLFKKLNKKGKFLFISSSEVYSGFPDSPFKESHIGTTNTNHPRACYIEGKRCGEAICNVYRSLGVDAKSVRLSLAYGPGTKLGDQRVMNVFIEKAFKGEIKLLDHGNVMRTYCYVTDAVEYLWHILLEGKESLYNVGGHSRISIADLAKKIGQMLNAKIVFPEKLEYDIVGSPDDVFLDMILAEKEFNKKEYVDLESGLKKTIQWQKLFYNL